ncbi:hypothetical protein B5E41_03015 [Rhizobium esperanzae]|uniref:Uncharacterized protein n=1 Tax=Rhizobium esperanzae TaxID=1967781 RepID=A0A246E0B8_9HYPH|nr:hypothetical protein B5E41_03015 [Rhizobium esperanzae]
MVNNSCDLYVPVSFQLDYHFCPLPKSAAMPVRRWHRLAVRLTLRHKDSGKSLTFQKSAVPH